MFRRKNKRVMCNICGTKHLVEPKDVYIRFFFAFPICVQCIVYLKQSGIFADILSVSQPQPGNKVSAVLGSQGAGMSSAMIADVTLRSHAKADPTQFEHPAAPQGEANVSTIVSLLEQGKVLDRVQIGTILNCDEYTVKKVITELTEIMGIAEIMPRHSYQKVQIRLKPKQAATV